MTYTVHSTAEYDRSREKLRDDVAKKAIARRLLYASLGNFGVTKSLGDGISELKIDVGPGYRIYYTRRGKQVILLLCAGDKSTQRSDIEKAKRLAATVVVEEEK